MKLDMILYGRSWFPMTLMIPFMLSPSCYFMALSEMSQQLLEGPSLRLIKTAAAFTG